MNKLNTRCNSQTTRRPTIARALTLLLAILSLGCSSTGKPRGNLTLPSDFSFVAQSKISNPAKTLRSWAAFVRDGNRWRWESLDPDRKYSTAIFDGFRLVTHPVATNPADVDSAPEHPAVKIIENWYVMLADAQFKGIETIDGTACYHYFVNLNAAASWSLWIDKETQTPRKLFVRDSNDERQETTYQDLPWTIGIDDELFDTRNLEPRLLIPSAMRQR